MYSFTSYEAQPGAALTSICIILEKKLSTAKTYTGKVVQFNSIFQKAFIFCIPGNQLYNLLCIILEFIYSAWLQVKFD